MPIITDSMIIKTRLQKVREIMQKECIDVYVVCTGDYHMSEYSSEYFNEREYLSGFTGSGGTLVVCMDKAALFTDGRYFVQAQLQLEGTQITLMKMGCKGVKTVEEYCRDNLKDKGKIGFDGRTVGALEGLKLAEMAEKKGAAVDFSFNAVEKIWEDRPKFPDSPAYELKIQYAGESRKSKIHRLREKMNELGADAHVIATLDDICWLLNIRGDDVECNPVVMSYLLILKDKVYLYTDKNKFSDGLIDALAEDGASIKAYNDIYSDVKSLKDRIVLIDTKRVNMKLYSSVKGASKIIEAQNPSVLMKAVKNNTEIENLMQIHIQDGLAVTHFMFWIKNKMKEYKRLQKSGADEKILKEYEVTEADAAEYLDDLRSRIDGYIELSFPTISAYNANAAMMHYSASKDNCSIIKPHGMLLVDSGGQYLKGTTDITRTFAMGEVTDEMKKHFTLTLKGMLALANAKFLHGCDGFSLDILARQPLWNEGIDYRCGTGHGIGYLLNVHEAPNGFRWKHNYGVNDLAVIEDGMVTSDEPGVYIDGKYGIRIENEILSCNDYENEYGQFMKFRMLTMVPIDLELVDASYLDDIDKIRLNEYHREVFEKLSPYMQGDELEFLRKYTREIE